MPFPFCVVGGLGNGTQAVPYRLFFGAKCKKGTSRRGCSFFGAADRIEGIKVLPPSRPAAGECPPDIRIWIVRVRSLRMQKRNIPEGMFLFWCR